MRRRWRSQNWPSLLSKAIAEHGAEQFEDVALAEFAIFGDEDLFDVVGMVGEMDFARAKTDGDEIAVVVRAARKEAEHIAAEFGQDCPAAIVREDLAAAAGGHGVSPLVKSLAAIGGGE